MKNTRTFGRLRFTKLDYRSDYSQILQLSHASHLDAVQWQSFAATEYTTGFRFPRPSIHQLSRPEVDLFYSEFPGAELVV
jgi:hypothetical protein